MTLRDLTPAHALPHVDAADPLARPRHEHATELPTLSDRSPVAVTLAALHGLAATLHRDGTKVRGAFALYYSSACTVTLVGSPPESSAGQGFAGRFLLPTTDNDGTPFPISVFVSLFRELYEQHGGATFGEATGIWRGEDGTFFVDRSITVEVWTSDRKALVRFVETARRVLRQECIVLRIERPEVVSIAGSASEVPS